MKPLFLAFALFGLAPPALAQDHAGHDMPAASTTESAATSAFKEANAAMHGEMDIQYTGNPDVDFILGMLPHHQGAVDMARIVLEHGDDPEVRKLAEDIIAAQEAEIAWMEEWLVRNGHASH